MAEDIDSLKRLHRALINLNKWAERPLVDVKMAMQPWVSLPPDKEQIAAPEVLAIGAH